MKVCFVGLGSIGCRHLKNLREILYDEDKALEVHAYREGNRKLGKDIEELVDRQIFNKADLDNDYDAVFITNPTNKHYDSIKLFSNKTKNMFIEKPIFDNSNVNCNEMTKLLDSGGVCYVAAPLRYTEVINSVKSIINENNVYSVRCICSSYLPDWRPNVDYRDVYSAHKDQGGGVSIDCIHELDYIFHLFGFPKESINIRGKYSDLEVDSEDLSVYVFRYEDKIVELHLDYFGKNKERVVEIYTKKGLFKGDFYRNQVTYPNGSIKEFNSSSNEMYLKELRAFLKMINGNQKNTNSINHSLKVLRIAEGEV